MSSHTLLIEFRDDGQVDFYPTTADPEELARRFARAIRIFIEYPSAIGCAAGHHEERA